MFEIVADENCFLAQEIASGLKKKIIVPEIKIFADTECVARIDGASWLAGKTVLVVQQVFFSNKKDLGGRSINDQLFQFLLLVDLVKKIGAKKIVALLPYLPYARQDKSFGGNYTGSAGLIGKFLKTAGVSDVVSFDLHAQSIKKGFAVNLHEIDMQDFWTTFLTNRKQDLFGGQMVCVVSPDSGRSEKNKKIANDFGADFAQIQKERVSPDRSVALKLEGDVKDKIVVVVDDIVDTARTAINSCELLTKHGAKKVYGCFTHAVMTNGALEKLENSCFKKIFITDTVQLKGDVIESDIVQVVHVGGLLVKSVKEIIR